ncbi:TPA: hypothetical protein ACY4Q9_002025 [Clostridium perfringens]|uniref:hypothetical protein n=1 Tax=Clostridium perfringens TaxID=1502 RepID=UPI000AEE31A3|nr:hypothetical protein [Clostridium perfringens]
MKNVINTKKVKVEIPYEVFAFFINTVMIIDFLRIAIGNTYVVDIIKNIVYIVTVIYILYHAFIHRHLFTLISIGTGYFILVLISLLLNNEIYGVILSGSMLFFTRCIEAFYLSYYIPINDIFFNKIKKYYIVVFFYCLLYITKNNSGIYSTDGSYMTFSYNILIMTTILIISCINKPTILKVVGTTSLIGIIITYGARGPILCIIISVMLFLGYKFISLPILKKLTYGSFFILIGLFFWGIRIKVIDFLLTINPSSRTLYLLKNFRLDSLSGRDTYYNLLSGEINKNWLNFHGIYSDRLILSANSMQSNIDMSQYYAHNLPIEIMYQFGAIMGGVILVYLFINIVNSYKTIINKNNIKLIIIYCSFFTGITTLFFSSSYLINERTWLAIGVIFSINKISKKYKR